jgi:hypothetical protein
MVDNEMIFNLVLQTLHKLEIYEELFVLQATVLKTKKGVANFFGVSEKTIDNWKENGKFEEGIEFFKNDKGRVEFIPQGILQFRKKNLNKFNGNNGSQKETKKIYHPSVLKIVKGI